jgi:hypothetical protein
LLDLCLKKLGNRVVEILAGAVGERAQRFHQFRREIHSQSHHVAYSLKRL